jgi:hypothetical protein
LTACRLADFEWAPSLRAAGLDLFCFCDFRGGNVVLGS